MAKENKKKKDKLIRKMEKDRGYMFPTWIFLAEKDAEFLNSYNSLYQKALNDGKALPASVFHAPPNRSPRPPSPRASCWGGELPCPTISKKSFALRCHQGRVVGSFSDSHAARRRPHFNYRSPSFNAHRERRKRTKNGQGN